MGDTPVEVALSIRAEHAEGPLWDAAARLWWVDITGQRVHCFDPASGNHSSWATAGQPGGMVLSAAGELVVAAVHRYRLDGTLDGAIELPVTNPTSVAFGGIDGGDLYITTSWFDLEPESRASQPPAGAIFRCRPGVTGPPAPRYADPLPAR